MKKLFFVLFFAIGTLMYAEYINSPFKGAFVVYTKEAGAIVKKGDPLFKLDDSLMKIEVKKEKLRLENCRSSLHEYEIKLKRTRNLSSKKAVSLTERENVFVEYSKRLQGLERQKIILNKTMHMLDNSIIKAPYDCQVLRQLICTSSGVAYDTGILEIQPLNAKVNPTNNTSKLCASIKFTSPTEGQGENITYLPKEGQILKKGDLLAKFDPYYIKLEINTLESSLKEAKECLKDAKSDNARAKKLFNANALSSKEYECICYLYQKSIIDTAVLVLDIQRFKNILNRRYTIRAPFNLKVLKRVLSIGSGIKMGEPILEVEKI